MPLPQDQIQAMLNKSGAKIALYAGDTKVESALKKADPVAYARLASDDASVGRALPLPLP